EPRPRGRPLLLDETARREKLIAAAEDAFLENGYHAARMDSIARRAGMSKKTLYRHFETKEALFAAVIGARAAAFMAQTDLPTISASPREALIALLGQVARLVLTPRSVALYRVVIAEGQRYPELANAFYREGPAKGRGPITRWLTAQKESGVLNIE